MKTKQRWIFLMLSVALCVALAACGIQRGPVIYLINGVWEESGNAFSITAVDVADSYTSDGGETVTPVAGSKLLVISCEARLSGQWKVASIHLQHPETEFTANWPKGPYETDGRTDYVFSVPNNLVEDETKMRFDLDVTLRDGEQIRAGHFALREAE